MLNKTALSSAIKTIENNSAAATASERVHARSGSMGWEVLFLFQREGSFSLHQPWELEPSFSFSGGSITNIIDCETVDPTKKATQLKVDVGCPERHYKGQLYKNIKV